MLLYVPDIIKTFLPLTDVENVIKAYGTLKTWRSEAGGTRPRMVEGRIMQELLSRVTQGSVTEEQLMILPHKRETFAE